jgi:hypothetical protein
MVMKGIRVARRPRIGIAVIAVAVALALAVVVLEARSLGAPSGAGAATGPAWPISSSGIDHPGAYRGGHYVGPTVGRGIDHPGVYRGGHVVVGPEPPERVGHRPLTDTPGK